MELWTKPKLFPVTHANISGIDTNTKEITAFSTTPLAINDLKPYRRLHLSPPLIQGRNLPILDPLEKGILLYVIDPPHPGPILGTPNHYWSSLGGSGGEGHLQGPDRPGGWLAPTGRPLLSQCLERPKSSQINFSHRTISYVIPIFLAYAKLNCQARLNTLGIRGGCPPTQMTPP